MNTSAVGGCTKFIFYFCYRDSRYLLILTENHAALTIVQQYLTESKKETDENEPVLIFGSSFPKDLEYTQVWQSVSHHYCHVMSSSPP